ncbi:HIT family protein [archaeon]|nr:HIT family protein [archaeon]|tara:strand:+ start:5232 stop:5768 length:537 start_codon:yes stop_codon:yes gene_type:complete
MVSEEDCLFCKIVRGDIPSKKVYEDSETLAILDINPASEGHVLVMPKKHSETLFEVDKEDLKAAISTVQKVSMKIKETLNPDGLNVVQNNGEQAGQVIAHTHFHVVPRYKDDKIIIGFPRDQTDEAKLDEILNKLRIETEKPVEEPKEPEPAKEEPQRDFSPTQDEEELPKVDDKWDF